jgi:hypothetical protein
MTSSTPIKAAPDGMITSTKPEHGLTDLRERESRGLISLATDAISVASDVGHDIHRALYDRSSTVSATDVQRQLLETLTCLETAEHYLRMLDEVIDPGPDEADCDKPEDTKTGDPRAK